MWPREIRWAPEVDSADVISYFVQELEVRAGQDRRHEAWQELPLVDLAGLR
jgi:hypothetical protein